MAVFRPFRGIRPKVGLADIISSLPYDVMNRKEAKEMAKGNPYSFLHVIRSEIDIDDAINPYDSAVYEKAKENLDKFIEDGTLKQDEYPKFYIYRQIMWGRVQTGLVGCASIDDYINDTIKKHEFTRPEKEVDRINNFDYCESHTEPIFLTYKKNDEINTIVNLWIKLNKPVYDFKSDDAITHIFWDITDLNLIKKIADIFSGIDYFYIADGHHRSASAVKVGLRKREKDIAYTGLEEYNFFLSVIFPDEDLYIMDYNRVVKDLNGNTISEFLEKVQNNFTLEEYKGNGYFRVKSKHTIGMFLENKWYQLTAKEGTFDTNNPVDRLDASILQNNLLDPVLGIKDPRTDKRIDFVGGIRGLTELEKRVSSDMKVAFAMYPTTIDDLISVANAGKVMPPKSTWFEPKLRSGLFIHKLFDIT